jgi:hypothetical protein
MEMNIEHKLKPEVLSVSVNRDNHFNQLFNRCGPGWTGGDSTYSTAISDTQVMWLFSDTFIGPVAADGKRNPETEMFVQGNTLVLQDRKSDSFTTYLRKTTGDVVEMQSLPTFAGLPYDTANCPNDTFIQKKDSLAMFQPTKCPSAKHCYYWGGAIVAEKKQLHTFLQLMEETKFETFGFAWHNSAIATFPLDKIDSAKPEYVDIPNNGVSYGGAVISDDNRYTYIYGMRPEPASNSLCSGHCIHISRVPHAQLSKPYKWHYWGRIATNPVKYGWTNKAEDSVPMAGDTAMASAPQTQDQLGVTKVKHCGKLSECYVMIAHQYTGGFTEKILAWYAAEPQGPWSGPVFVYNTPESQQQLFTYNAKIHPEFTNEEGLLVSYDVNTLVPFSNPLNAFITAASYRPRFIRVKLQWEK